MNSSCRNNHHFQAFKLVELAAPFKLVELVAPHVPSSPLEKSLAFPACPEVSWEDPVE